MSSTPIGSLYAPLFREYYIVFENADRLNWFEKLFVRDGFEHVSLLMPLMDGTIHVTHTKRGTDIHFYKINVEDAAKVMGKQNKTIVYIPHVRVNNYKLHLSMFIPSCVTMVMKFTGLTCGTIIPYSYYRWLLKNNGRLLYGRNV